MIRFSGLSIFYYSSSVHAKYKIGTYKSKGKQIKKRESKREKTFTPNIDVTYLIDSSVDLPFQWLIKLSYTLIVII